MSVGIRTYTIASFWNSNDVLDTLNTALSDVGFHAPAQTGTILTFTNTAGTTIASEKGKRYLVKQSATSGAGTYCTFDVVRNASTGAVATVTLVNGGEGYANNNTITLSGADLGGVAPTDNITVTVSTVSGSQGGISTYYDKDTASPYTWGICCVNQDITKKMGQTYYGFYIAANPTTNPILYFRAGPGWQPNTNVYNGVATLDYAVNSVTTTTAATLNVSQVIASSNAVQLTLRTYQSGIDSNFVVFQFSEESKYGIIYRNPFILSKYNSATQPWSLDDCFTGAIYEITKTQAANTYDCQIATTTITANSGVRLGEYGYSGLRSAAAYRVTGTYESTFGKRLGGASQTVPGIYHRSLHDLAHSSLEYNPVITGIPINNSMVPVPYYIPADFGVTEVIGTNNISYGDTLTVSGNTYRVLQYANNQNAVTYNTSIAFVAQTA